MEHYALLKHSQYKNDAIQFKNFLGLRLPPFFFPVYVTEKGGNFKIKKFFNWIASFLYWLHFKYKGFSFLHILENFNNSDTLYIRKY